MSVTITKEFGFDSSHRLNNPILSENENINIFGRCNNLPSHGHSYKLLVTVKKKCYEEDGEDYLENGMVINFTLLKKIVNESVIDIFDHHFIDDIECMKGRITTCENTIKVIWSLLEEPLSKERVELVKLRLYETDTSFCEMENDKKM